MAWFVRSSVCRPLSCARARACPVALDQQDRGKWDQALITEGVALVSSVLPLGDVGPHQVQVAIAAVHDEAPAMDATDWPQILALYDLLEQLAHGPMVSLNRAVAVAMVTGPGCRPGPARHAKSPTAAGEPPPAARHKGAPAGDGRRLLRSSCQLPGGRPTDHQHPRTPVPAGPGSTLGRNLADRRCPEISLPPM